MVPKMFKQPLCQASKNDHKCESHREQCYAPVESNRKTTVSHGLKNLALLKSPYGDMLSS